MKPIVNILSITLGLVVLADFSNAQSPAAKTPDDLVNLRAAYEKAEDQALDPITKRYIDALYSLKTKYSQAGNLDGAVAVDQAIKGVAEPDATKEKSNVEELIALRKTYDKSKAEATSPLTKKYVEALAPIKLKYTQMGNLDAALAVEKEIKTHQAMLAATAITSEPIDANKLIGTKWRLPRHYLPETPDGDKWVQFEPKGVLKCGWSPKTFIWNLDDPLVVRFRPFKSRDKLLLLKWDNVSDTAIISEDGTEYEVSRKKG